MELFHQSLQKFHARGVRNTSDDKEKSAKPGRLPVENPLRILDEEYRVLLKLPEADQISVTFSHVSNFRSKW